MVIKEDTKKPFPTAKRGRKMTNKTIKIVEEYYDENADYEDMRLKQDAYHSIEQYTTLQFIKKILPKKGLIADIGCGTGAYAIPLAKKGYKLSILDLSQKIIEKAHKNIKKAGVEKNIISAHKGSVTNLSIYRDDTFDAVLCMGPMYHLTRRKDQAKAVEELGRIAKKNAPIIISCINYYGIIPMLLRHKEYWYEFTDKNHQQMFRRGVHKKEWHPKTHKSFPDAKFWKPEELEEFMKSKGFTTITIFACEGLAGNFRREVNQLAEESAEEFESLKKLILKNAESPYGFGATEHFVWAGVKKGGE